MIYSENINKVCGLCVNAESIDGNDESMFCTVKKENVGISDTECKKFQYDIFKKKVRRKKRLKTNYDPNDFKL